MRPYGLLCRDRCCLAPHVVTATPGVANRVRGAAHVRNCFRSHVKGAGRDHAVDSAYGIGLREDAGPAQCADEHWKPRKNFFARWIQPAVCELVVLQPAFLIDPRTGQQDRRVVHAADVPHLMAVNDAAADEVGGITVFQLHVMLRNFAQETPSVPEGFRRREKLRG
jgi:hypothetical protein